MKKPGATAHHGEWLPRELAAEIRGLLAESPAAAHQSPGLLAWLACKPNEGCPQGDDRQSVQKRRLPEDGDASPQLPSSQAAVAPDEKTHEGTKWGASEEWMSGVFALLEPHNLKNARLVSQGWAKQTISIKSSICIAVEKQDEPEDLVERVDGLSYTIGRNRLSGLEVLELKSSWPSTQEPSTSFASLLTAACGGCPLLKTLKLNLGVIDDELVDVLEPLLPRLQSLSLSGFFECYVDPPQIEWLLSSMTNLTDLHLDCSLDCAVGCYEAIPGEMLAVLPQGLARLSIEHVKFDSIGLRDLPCSNSLTDLTVKKCYFKRAMGLSAAVNLKSLSILDEATVTHEDLEDILGTLGKLEHLCIDLCNIEVFPDEGSATAFVQRLQVSLPLLKSLELKSLSEYNEGILVALGKFTGLTSLNLGKTFVPSAADDMSLPPHALRHLTTLKALKHLSLNGQDLLQEEEREFLATALPILQSLPSLESLDVTGLDVTELNAPLFPLQLKSLGIGYALYETDPQEETAVLLALAERCPGMNCINLWSEPDILPYSDSWLCFQSLAAVHKTFPKLQFNVEAGIRSPVDCDTEVLMMMEDLDDLLIRAQPFLQLLERSVPWNTPKHPWNLLSSRESWVVVARNVIGMCGEIAAGDYYVP